MLNIFIGPIYQGYGEAILLVFGCFFFWWLEGLFGLVLRIVYVWIISEVGIYLGIRHHNRKNRYDCNMLTEVLAVDCKMLFFFSLSIFTHNWLIKTFFFN